VPPVVFWSTAPPVASIATQCQVIGLTGAEAGAMDITGRNQREARS